MWFFLITFGAALALYYSAMSIDYVWRWYRIPQYFCYLDKVEIRAEIDGEVESITTKDAKVVIVVKGLDESESYSVPTESVSVEEGDFIYPGDVLAKHEKWRVGILLQGLWLTLKVSFVAIIFGIFIGLFAGLARIASNPALKWSAITYIELIRGSPLLVQIFIWYFFWARLLIHCWQNKDLGRFHPSGSGLRRWPVLRGHM